MNATKRVPDMGSKRVLQPVGLTIGLIAIAVLAYIFSAHPPLNLSQSSYAAQGTVGLPSNDPRQSPSVELGVFWSVWR